jgi:protein-arginine kinase
MPKDYVSVRISGIVAGTNGLSFTVNESNSIPGLEIPEKNKITISSDENNNLVITGLKAGTEFAKMLGVTNETTLTLSKDGLIGKLNNPAPNVIFHENDLIKRISESNLDDQNKASKSKTRRSP